MAWLNSYTLTRQRKHFGRQTKFSDYHELIVDIPSDHSLMKHFTIPKTVDCGTQLSKQYAINVINTEDVKLQRRQIFHVEGGWPKDVNYNDEESVTRYKKKVEREESWQDHVTNMEKRVMEVIAQNNAIDIYGGYFEDKDFADIKENYTACILNEYRDQEMPSREISNLEWDPNAEENFVTVYGFPDLYEPTGYSTNNYLWNINDPIKPFGVLKSPSFATCINWNPKDAPILAGSLHNGSVCCWDSRAGIEPIAISPLETSHRDICSALVWVQSKSNTEFYSGSMDGTIHYWDERNLSKPFNVFMLDPIKADEQDIQRSHGCTVLEFEISIPVRFMAGTDKGYVFLGNRKAATHKDIMVDNFQVMAGPVKSMERNPFYVKYFLVVGDWCTKIWTEDCRFTPLIRFSNHKSQLNCGTWSKNRGSLYFTGRDDGTVDFWDLLLDQKQPIYSLDIFKSPINVLRSNTTGTFLAVGTKKGDVSLVKLDKAMTESSTTERTLLSALFEREVNRVKILEGRMREILLKHKQNHPAAEKLNTITEVVEGEEEDAKEEGEILLTDKTKKTDTNTEADEEIIKEHQQIPEDEAESEYYAIDPSLPAIIRQFEMITTEEQEKRKTKERTFTKTPFEIQIENPDQLDIQSQKKLSVDTKITDEESDDDFYGSYDVDDEDDEDADKEKLEKS